LYQSVTRMGHHLVIDCYAKLMADEMTQARINLVKALQQATIEKRLDWIRTNADEVKWKEGTVEQRYTMVSPEGVFVTLSRMEDSTVELLVEVQETGCYRSYEVSKTDGDEVAIAVLELYRSLPSNARMVEDFEHIAHYLQSESDRLHNRLNEE
jgi:DNA-directed RNA polymerase alpha subunit